MNKLTYTAKQKIGYLTLVETVGKTSQGNMIWRCACDCGKIVNRATDSLGESIRHGCIISCGCKRFAKKKADKAEANYVAEVMQQKKDLGIEVPEIKSYEVVTEVKDYSNVKGVSAVPGKNKWKARISVNGSTKHLGTFNSFEEACEARLAAEKEFR